MIEKDAVMFMSTALKKPDLSAMRLGVFWFVLLAIAAVMLAHAQSAHASARGEYFNGITLSGTPVERFDQNINFDWQGDSPIAGIGNDNFSVRWTSQLSAPATAPYTICAVGDDGVRLWVNGELLINDWIDSSAKERCGTIALTGSQTYSLKLEYYERGGQASIKLLWSSPSFGKQIIGAEYLSCCSDRNGVGARIGKGRDPVASEFTIAGSREINFNWGLGAARNDIGADGFTIRWSGSFSPKTSGQYKFYVTGDDGVRLRLNGQTVIDKWFDQSVTTYSAAYDVQAGSSVGFELDYFENGGLASVKLEWEGPGQPREVIPMGAFFAQFGFGGLLNSSTVQNGTNAGPVNPPPVASAKTYYVAANGNDANSGSQGAPFASIQKAFDVVQPGEGVEIAGGTYNIARPIRLSNKKATQAKPIIVEGKNTPVLRWTAGVLDDFDGVITVRDSSYVTVRGLRIENAGLFGLLAQQTDHVTFEKNAIDTSIASGIAYFTGTNAVVRGNDLARFCDRGQTGTRYNCQEGLSIADVDGFDVDANTVRDAQQLNSPSRNNPGGGEGIDVKGASRNGAVRNNRVYNLNQLGIYVDGYSKQVQNVQVYNNIVHNTASGIVIAAELETGSVRNVDVFNNLVYNNGLSGISISGTYVGNMPGGQAGPRENIRIFHNTIHSNGLPQYKPSWASGNYGYGIHVDAKAISGILIANNVVENNSLGQVAVRQDADRTRVIIDRNLSFPFGKGGQELAGNNAITSTAQFADVAKANFRLTQQSPAIGAANASSPKPEFDLDGKKRDAAGPSDLGAYEF
jgi:hypothetical protein